MEISDLLEKFEALFYKILVLIILIPKTIGKLYYSKTFFINYIDQQFELEESERFNDHVSPLLLTAIIAVCPIVYTNMEKQSGAIGIFDNTKDKLMFTLISLAIVPLLIATFILLLQKKRIDAETLKRPVYKLMYIFVIPDLGMPLFLIGAKNSHLYLLTLLGVASVWIGGIVLLFRLYTFYKSELSERKRTSLMSLYGITVVSMLSLLLAINWLR